MSSLRIPLGASEMNKSLMSNILNFERKLKEAGIGAEQAHQQAEATAELIDSMVNTHLATKADILSLKNEIHQASKELEIKLTIRLGAIIVGALGLISYVKTF